MKKILLLLILFSIQTFAQFEGTKYEWIYGNTFTAGQSVDLDGSTEYMSATPALKLTGNYALRDDFSDGNYTGWTVSTGAYTVDNAVANPLNTNQYSLKCTTAGIISIPCNQAYGEWSFDLYSSVLGNTSSVLFINGNTQAGTSYIGYRIYLSSNGRVALEKCSGSSAASISYSVSSYTGNGVWYHIRLTRNTNGQYYFYITGGAFATETLVNVTGGVGTNPFTDNTYTSSNYFVLDLDANDRISNIVCQYGEGSLDLNSFERIYHSDNRTMATVGQWIAVGSATVDTSSTQKHSGTKALKVVTNGAWSGVQLPYANFVALSQDANGIYEKYTPEYWVYNESADSVKVVIGDKSIIRSVPATTWTKFVFNFQATANTINQNIQILWKTTGKTNYIDDVSLTKAWDYLINIYANIVDFGASNTVIIGLGAPTAYPEIMIRSSSDNSSVAFDFGDGTYPIAGNSFAKTLSQNTWALYTVIVNRTGNSELFLNGVSKGTSSLASIGSVKWPTQALILGYGSGASRYVNGKNGDTQISKFTDIAQSNVSAGTLLQAYRGGLSTWTGGGAQIVAWYDFRGNSDSQMLRDKSGNGNNLTGTNVNTADQVRGTYPSK